MVGVSIVGLLYIISNMIARSHGNYTQLLLDTTSVAYYLRTTTRGSSEDDECKAYYKSIDKEIFTEDRGLEKRAIEEMFEVSSVKRVNQSFTPLCQEDINSVKQFVFFIGYARSGHSIVASLLDAHPHMVIAHEFNLFSEWTRNQGKRLSNRTYLYNKLWANSYNNALNGWRSEQKSQKGYSLDIDSVWRGSFDKLLVIGDKSGGKTARVFQHSPDDFNKIVESLRTTVGVPIKVLHVIRNPYDMIATRLLYVAGAAQRLKSKLNATVDHKYCDILELQQRINSTIALTTQVNNFLSSTNLNVLNIHLVDLIENPGRILKEMCTFLSVECTQDYINICTKKLFKKEPRTRDTVFWPEWLVERVYTEIIKPLPSFRRYSFDGS